MDFTNLAFIHVRQIATMAGPRRARTGREMEELGLLEDGALFIRNGRIAGVGRTETAIREFSPRDFTIVDLRGRDIVMTPGFVDCHTHPAFCGTREEEYEQRIQGVSYEEIAQKGGGILNSAKRVHRASQAEIERNILCFSRLFLEYGTTTIEAKSGYGLSLEGELKLLRAIREAGRSTPLDLVPTFLGAHAYPLEFKNNHRGYLDEIIQKMLPAVAVEKLARFCDVFCDRGFFSLAETREILSAASRLGLRPKIHADELAAFGAAELAVEMGAIGADHLEQITPRGIKAMAAGRTVAGLLPGTAYNLALEAYPPARQLLAAGVPVALATDFNPGSCFTLNMQLILSIACTQMKLTPAEGLTAATINGAWALDLGDDRGSLEVGKRADIALLACPSYKYIPYFFGVNHCVETIKNGIPLRGLSGLPETPAA